MASLNIRAITLSQTAAFSSKKQELTVTQAGVRYKRDPQTHQPTSEVEGYMVNVRTPRTGEVQTVKLPLEVADTIHKIKSALEDEKLVQVTFKGTFRGRFWAMNDAGGRINMGLSATASALEIVSIEDMQDDILADEDF